MSRIDLFRCDACEATIKPGTPYLSIAVEEDETPDRGDMTPVLRPRKHRRYRVRDEPGQDEPRHVELDVCRDCSTDPVRMGECFARAMPSKNG